MNEARHLTDREIVRLVDEGHAEDRGRAHLEACGSCRARLDATRAIMTALGAAPPPANETELAAQRERILAAVRARPRRGARVPRRAVWPAVLAAAAVAALLLWAPRPGPGPEITATDDSSTGPPVLPVVVEATRAAEEAIRAAAEPGAVEELVEASPVDDTDVSLSEPDPALLDGWEAVAALEQAFAGLSVEDRRAILAELASADLGAW